MRTESNCLVDKAAPPPAAWRAPLICNLFAALLSATFFMAGCQSSQPGGEVTPARTAASATPAVPPEYTAGAQNYLGPSAEVPAFGDLALSGGEQILVADPMPGAQEVSSPGIRVVRAVVLERRGDRWKEIFRCDERLTNEKGFLMGAPTRPVSGWQMEFTQVPASGLELKFTEAETASDANQSATYVVRWNRMVKRYECLDKKGDRFLGELPAVGDPVSRELRR